MAKILQDVDYVILQNSRAFTNPYIMQVEQPYCIGLPIKIDQRNTEDIEVLMKSMANGDCLAKVPGYSVFILPKGTFTGMQTTEEQMKEALEGMAKFYLETHIESHKGAFRRSLEGYVEGTIEAEGRKFKALREAMRKTREENE